MDIVFTQMQEQDMASAVKLVARAMNKQESEWAQGTFEYYFQCLKCQVDSARDYYIAWFDREMCGLVGLHHYRWGPKSNVWLSWFAVEPVYQGQGVGRQLLQYIEGMARQAGYQQLLIETYSSQEFARARNFYIKCGYVQTGEIPHYIDDDISMLVYRKRL